MTAQPETAGAAAAVGTDARPPAPARGTARPGRPDRPSRQTGRKPGQTLRGTVLVTVVLALVALYFVLPVYWVAVNATKSSDDLFGTNGFWFGTEFLLVENIRSVFSVNGGIFPRWALNSLVYSGIGAALATYFAAAAGYALAKFEFRGRNLIYGLVLGGVLVPGTATALPLFFLFSGLGLTNTYWSVLIPSMVSPFGMFLARIYAGAAVPDTLLEAGRLDGATEGRIFHSLVLRQLTPALVTIFLFQFVAIWNNYFLPLVMLADESLYPITLGLDNWLAQTDRLPEFYQLTVTGSLLSVIPLGILMLVLQRFWRGGLTEGAVKG
jgi:multiple sugar transport system permease protein